MVSLKWGDVLSHLLPGAVGLYAAAPLFPALARLIGNPNAIGAAAGLALLMAAALVGGILEAITRVTWERHVLVRFCKPPDILRELTKDNLELYERGVQSSYKYVTFYSNFALATIFLLVSRFVFSVPVPSIMSSLLPASVIVVLLWASYVQWTYYVNYQTKVFGPRSQHVQERSSVGNGAEDNADRPKSDAGASTAEVRSGSPGGTSSK